MRLDDVRSFVFDIDGTLVCWAALRTVLVRSTSASIDLTSVSERRRPHASIEGVGELLAWL